MRFPVKAVVLAIGIIALSACDRSHDEAHEHPPAGAPTTAQDDGHGHDHPHGDADHSHDDPHTETYFRPDAANDDASPSSPAHTDHQHEHEHDHGHDDGHDHDDDKHAHNDEEPHEH